jgi:hypothetical protein
MSLNGFALIVALLHNGHASGLPPRSTMLLSARLTITNTCKLLHAKNGNTMWRTNEPVRVERRFVQDKPGSRTLLVTLLF